tara:strand:- start:176 stop:820 length:645 start_codon:yes stop_codon:yes gene_type:complete
MLNNRLYNLLFIISFVFSDSSEILSDFNTNFDWVLVEEKNNMKIFEYNNPSCDCLYSKIEQPVNHNEKDILNVISSIDKYNIVIKNKSLNTELIDIENDTIYAYQIIKNSVPFIRDRQYVFKMYYINENHLEWMIVDENSSYLIPYLNDDVRTLNLGAGSWSFRYENSKKILINKIYVDDGVNLPWIFINKLKRDHVVQIFNDVLDSIKETKGE